MNKEFKNGKLYIDGKPTFVLIGEVQYFRTEKRYWRKMLRRLKESGCNCVSTYVPWNWHEIEEGVMDFEGRTHPCRDVKAFLDMVIEEDLLLVLKPGPFVHNEMRNGGLPEWMFENYPEIHSYGPNGGTSAKQATYCHPVYMDLVKKWYSAFAGTVKDYSDNVIFWQVDNEISYYYTFFHRHGLASDYHDFLIDDGLYQKYLKSVHKRIERLNERYGSRYKEFSRVKPPRTVGKGKSSFFRVFDWIGFKEWLGIRFLKQCCDMLYDLGIEGPFVLNAPFHGYFTMWHELIQALNKGKYQLLICHCDYPGPVYEGSVGEILSRIEFCKSSQSDLWGNNEIQSCNVSRVWEMPGHSYDLLYRIVIGYGLRMINYYWFCDGENFLGSGMYGKSHQYDAPLTKEGKPRDHFYQIKRFNKFVREHPEITEYTKQYDIGVGYLHDYARMSVFPNSYGGSITGDLISVVSLIAMCNISFKMVNLKTLEEQSKGVGTIVVPSAKFMPRYIQNKILTFVKSGGRIVLTHFLPLLDEHLKECALLADALGIEKVSVGLSGTGPEDANLISMCGVEMPVVDRAQIYELSPNKRGSSVIASVKDGCCGVACKIGKGELVVLGFELKYRVNANLDAIISLLNKGERTHLITSVLNKGKDSLTTVLNVFDEDKKFMIDGTTRKVPGKKGIFIMKKNGKTEIVS